MIEDLTSLDLAPLAKVLEDYAGQKGAVIPILQHAQDIYGYLPKEVLVEISKHSGIPLSQLIGVATFYAQFRLTRRGKHLIRVCDGTACHVRGAAKCIEAVEKQLNVPAGSTSGKTIRFFFFLLCIVLGSVASMLRRGPAWPGRPWFRAEGPLEATGLSIRLGLA